MASVNKVIIVGNLGKDPETSYTPSGMAVCRFSVATTDTWTDKATGQKKEKTEWHRIVVFQKMAENCGKFLTKGSPVYIEGKLQTSSYEKDGITRYNTDILANAIQFLGARGEDGGAPKQGGGYPHNSGYQGGGGGYQKSGPAYPQNNRGPQNAPPQNRGGYSQDPAPDFDPYMGDSGFQPQQDQSDIPF